MVKKVRKLVSSEEGLGVIECQLILASTAIAVTVLILALGMQKLMPI